ncbi:phosphate ABC transporter permease PstA [Roseococcus sp. SDR]|uniref:phosphate ABC transporter permease PstA n=1 Tax=Roseococcus sp. SDR TaxID=2835532 RepID=UPI001BCFD2BC|nr:phosphate ABC transporter permease PstA [Roseococcus sp. SDR]MBS7790696.1 phosphate ABC transporter permease PstA [Roseococcus sp. SDR]MBV1846010.1 phosphate ABC transporter permease PstA [Roseococcus sp. SDR]
MSTTTFNPASAPAKNMSVARALGRRRRLVDRTIQYACVAATVIGLIFLASILVTLFLRGFAALDWTVLTKAFEPTTYGDDTAPRGGLSHAIVGTLIQTTLATLIGTPIGLLVGTYLAEYARGSKLGEAVRFVSDVLLSAPSILIGLFIYQLVVLPMGGFSGFAGTLALAVIVIPVVVRTTEDMLQLIPNTLREAVVALGAPKWKMVVLVCWRAAVSGIVTGILLAFARIAGETAPLLLTSFGNNVMSTDLSTAMASLPVAIYQQANSGFPDLISIAWAGALLVTLGVLAVNIIARVLLRKRK